MLVSEDSSTRMASLDEGKLVLRGTRTVETAGTLVAVGLLRDSSGLLLDRLVELGSSGGDKPDILTNRCYPFAGTGSCNDPRELRSAPQGRHDETKTTECGTLYKPNKTSLRMDIYVQCAKVEFGEGTPRMQCKLRAATGTGEKDTDDLNA